MTDNKIKKALEILDKLDFFGGQRAGRELWFDKPVDVQNKDIENFSKDIAFLKDLINRYEAKIERLIGKANRFKILFHLADGTIYDIEDVLYRSTYNDRAKETISGYEEYRDNLLKEMGVEKKE